VAREEQLRARVKQIRNPRDHHRDPNILGKNPDLKIRELNGSSQSPQKT
jgi:hypothetical protein